MAAQAAPMFARQYGVSCVTCHSAFPKLNEYGGQFAANNFRMPNWKDSTLQTGDDQPVLHSQYTGHLSSEDYILFGFDTAF